jgi:hypothetical protein
MLFSRLQLRVATASLLVKLPLLLIPVMVTQKPMLPSETWVIFNVTVTHPTQRNGLVYCFFAAAGDMVLVQAAAVSYLAAEVAMGKWHLLNLQYHRKHCRHDRILRLSYDLGTVQGTALGSSLAMM